MSDLMTLEWAGKKYELSIQSVTTAEWREVKTHTGLTAGKVITAMSNADDLDAEVGTALLWLFKKKAGENPEFEDDLPFFEFMGALARMEDKAPKETKAPKA